MSGTEASWVTDPGYQVWGLSAILIPAVILLSVVLMTKKNHGNYPPKYEGFLPWLGCAIEFGKEPLYFLQRAKSKLGPIFTVCVTGKRLTWLMDKSDFHHFFQSPNVDFQRGVQDAVERTSGVTPEGFFQNHTRIHDCVKGRLAVGKLPPLFQSLQKKFYKELTHFSEKGEGDLSVMVRSSMYKAVIENLFGDNVLPTQPQTAMNELEEHFVRFDDQFEYGSQLPGFLLRDWSRSKQWLLNLFKKITPGLSKKSSEDQTLLQSLLQTVDGQWGPNFGLMMLWASLANAIPITFWTLALILSHPEVYEKVEKEIKEVLGPYKGSPVEISEDMLRRLPTVKQCMLEAIRLHSPGAITRRVVKPIQIKGHTIPAGDMLMLSPYWAHRDPDLFPEPEAFKPDRWPAADLDKNMFLEGFVAFGGGRYQCPGRWFALMEIHLYVTLTLHMYQIELKGSVPKHSPLHLVGTQQPEGPCIVSIKSRE